MTPAPNTSWGGTRRSFPPALRKRIMDRDHWQCQIQGPTCTGHATQADHITPWARGGTDTIANGQAVCEPCHNLKTEHERAQGRARHSRKRTPPKHPGLTGG